MEMENISGTMDMETIARICHNVNRAYCAAMGDHSQLDWYNAPQWQRDSMRDGVRAHLRTPDGLAPEASHNNWLALKRSEGWKYGPVKDLEAKTHPCFVPHAELPLAQQAKDYIVAAIIAELRAELRT